MSDFYRAFEERYRGSRDLIKGRLRSYTGFTEALATLYPGALALDLGCGRGEWLELSAEIGFTAHGVDLDEAMLAACRERGLSVQTADALATLRAQPDASVAMVSAFHLVEHLPFDDVQTLIAEAMRVLLPGGLLIMETPNPENLIVGTSNFYLDPSHLKPVPPMLLEFMTDFAGFARHKVVRLQGAPAEADTPVGMVNILQDVSADYSVVAQKQGEAALLAPFDAAFAEQYGTPLIEMAARFDYQQSELRQTAHAGAAAAAEHRAALAQQQEALAQAQASLDRQQAALDQRQSALEAQAATQVQGLQAGLSALDNQDAEQARALAGLDEALRRLIQSTGERLDKSEEANTLLWSAALPGLEQRMMALEQAHAGLKQQSAAFEAQVQDALHQLDLRTERRVNELEERRLDGAQNGERRFDEIERRLATSDRRLAPITDELVALGQRLGRNAEVEREVVQQQARALEAEALLAQARQQLDQSNQRIAQLEQHISAIHGSTSWRLTTPVRVVGGLARRGTSAARDGRIGSGLRRRAASLVLGDDHTRGVRGLLRRTANNALARRIALPLLRRFPGLQGPLRRAVLGTPAPVVSRRAVLPDWAGPLPADFLDMPESARQVLLDLARAGQPPSNP